MLLNELEVLIRDSISEESDAVARYVERKDKLQTLLEIGSDADPQLKEKLSVLIKTYQDILEEEQVHIGQLEQMLEYIGISDNKEQEGKAEAQQDIGGLTFSELGQLYKEFLI